MHSRNKTSKDYTTPDILPVHMWNQPSQTTQPTTNTDQSSTPALENEYPVSSHSALKDPKWREAVIEEMKALEQNETWKIVNLPKGKKLVGCKWVFPVKYNSDGSIERYKARLVAEGFSQTYGLDYQETFAPVAKINSTQMMPLEYAAFAGNDEGVRILLPVTSCSPSVQIPVE